MELLNIKEQSTMEGLYKIININPLMNKGLSNELKKAFPYSDTTFDVCRPIINFESIAHPNWLVGFVDAEGCFYVNINKSKSKIGFQVKLAFSISQHSRDELLLSFISNYLGCGNLEKPSTRLTQASLVTYKLSDIYEKIIPFFTKHPLHGLKLLDFNDFCKITLLMKNKSHLTSDGLKQIRLIKSGMNTGREY
jgi:hypothetical protein